jgi:hypothetical protein
MPVVKVWCVNNTDATIFSSGPFKSHLRNQKRTDTIRCLFFFSLRLGDLNLTAFGTKARPLPLAAECRANNLQPKRKGLSILFATVDGTKQGVCRAEQAQARADDYATAAEGREDLLIVKYFIEYLMRI